MARDSEVTAELVPAAHTVTLWKSDEPDEIVAQARKTADSLARVVEDQELYVTIRGRKHVRVEGWTLLGTMLGVFPVTAWTRKLDDGWEARVEARTRAGELVGAAEAECLNTEQTWSTREDYALRSMAQTRATSKALRQPLGFVLTLAGFDATPAEEMPRAARTGQPLTGQQRKAAYAIAGRLEKTGVLTADAMELGLWKRYGTGKISELSSAQASDLIDRLMAKEEEGEAVEVSGTWVPDQEGESFTGASDASTAQTPTPSDVFRPPVGVQTAIKEEE